MKDTKSSEALQSYEKRDLGGYDFISLLIDGKYMAKEQIVIALGITTGGDKLLLGFIQTTTSKCQSSKRFTEKFIR